MWWWQNLLVDQFLAREFNFLVRSFKKSTNILRSNDFVIAAISFLRVSTNCEQLKSAPYYPVKQTEYSFPKNSKRANPELSLNFEKLRKNAFSSDYCLFPNSDPSPASVFQLFCVLRRILKKGKLEMQVCTGQQPKTFSSKDENSIEVNHLNYPVSKTIRLKNEWISNTQNLLLSS